MSYLFIILCFLCVAGSIFLSVRGFQGKLSKFNAGFGWLQTAYLTMIIVMRMLMGW